MAFELVHKGKTKIYWNRSLSARENIECLLSEGFSIQTDKGQLLVVEGFLYGPALPAEREAASKIAMAAKKKSVTDESFLEEVESLLSTLPSHDKKGKPSFVYAILQHAVRESTNTENKKKDDADEKIASMNSDNEKIQKQIDEGHARGNKLEAEKLSSDEKLMGLIHEHKHLVDENDMLSSRIANVDGKIKLVDEKIKSVSDRNKKLEELKATGYQGKLHQLPDQKAREDEISNLKEKSQEKYRKQEKINENKEEELKKETAKKEKLSGIFAMLTNAVKSIAQIVSPSNPFLQSEAPSNPFSTNPTVGLVKFIKQQWILGGNKSTGSETRGSAIAENAAVDADQKGNEGRVVDEKSKKSYVWMDDVGLCANMERLMDDYLKGTHSPDRKLSAEKVRHEIIRLNRDETDPEKRDQMLLGFIRREDIATHGRFNLLPSQLHSIYRQAELTVRNRLKRINENKSTELLDLQRQNRALVRYNIRLESRNKEFDKMNRSSKSKITEQEGRNEKLKAEISTKNAEIERKKSLLTQKREALIAANKRNVQLATDCYIDPREILEGRLFQEEQSARIDAWGSSERGLDALVDEGNQMDRGIAKLRNDNAEIYEDIKGIYQKLAEMSEERGAPKMEQVYHDASSDVMRTAEELEKAVEHFATALQEKVAEPVAKQPVKGEAESAADEHEKDQPVGYKPQ